MELQAALVGSSDGAEAEKRLMTADAKRALRGVAITPTSVAEEAGVDRTTVYCFHEPVLTQIRKLNEKAVQTRLSVKRGELGEMQAKVREYSEMLERQREEMTAWARQNYALSHKVLELEQVVRQRDAEIADLQAQLAETENVVALKPGYRV